MLSKIKWNVQKRQFWWDCLKNSWGKWANRDRHSTKSLLLEMLWGADKWWPVLLNDDLCRYMMTLLLLFYDDLCWCMMDCVVTSIWWPVSLNDDPCRYMMTVVVLMFYDDLCSCMMDCVVIWWPVYDDPCCYMFQEEEKPDTRNGGDSFGFKEERGGMGEYYH